VTTRPQTQWELWVSSFDDNGFVLDFNKLKHATSLDNMAVIAQALNEHAQFTPRFYTLPGSKFSCHEHFTPISSKCGRQCSNSGRYCASDPDGNLTSGLDGVDVLQENLRQMCIASVLKLEARPMSLWWRYVLAFTRKCKGVPPKKGETVFDATTVVDATHSHDGNSGNTAAFKLANLHRNKLTEYGLVCSATQMGILQVDASKVDACVTQSGGAAFSGGANRRFAAEMAEYSSEGVVELPRLVINGQQYFGRMDCPAQWTPKTCPPLVAICASFGRGVAPPACTEAYWRDYWNKNTKGAGGQATAATAVKNPLLAQLWATANTASVRAGIGSKSYNRAKAAMQQGSDSQVRARPGTQADDDDDEVATVEDADDDGGSGSGGSGFPDLASVSARGAAGGGSKSGGGAGAEAFKLHMPTVPQAESDGAAGGGSAAISLVVNGKTLNCKDDLAECSGVSGVLCGNEQRNLCLRTCGLCKIEEQVEGDFAKYAHGLPLNKQKQMLQMRKNAHIFSTQANNAAASGAAGGANNNDKNAPAGSGRATMACAPWRCSCQGVR
jgi:hypothetical protein